MPVVGNRIKVASSSTGTGNITLGSAEDGFQTFADGGISNNDVVRYVITEGSSFEIGKGTYLTSGPTLTRTSGNLLESSTGSLLNLGGSATVFVSLADTDVMQTDGGTFTGDVTFDGATAGYDIVFDRSDNSLNFKDNAKAKFGTGGDLQIYHHGGSAFIDDVGDGSLGIRSNGFGVNIMTEASAFMGQFSRGGAVTLYHNGNSKFATTSGGINVTGTVTDDGATHDGDVTFTGASYNAVWDKSDNALEFADNAELRFGAGNDFKIFHNGSQTYLSEEGTGDLRIRGGNLRLHAPNDEPYLVATANGAVELYYDNSKKFETTSSGIQTTGTVNVNGAYTLPTSDGSANQVLTTDGAGAVTFADAGGGADLYTANPSSATDPSATGANAIAIGSNAGSTGTNGIAIGTGADVLNSRSNAIAIGVDAGANGNQSIAMGENALTYSGTTSSIALGYYSKARGADALALGTYADAGNSSARTTSIGYNAVSATGNHATALTNSYASGADSFAAAIANNTSSYGATTTGAIAIGDQAKSTGGFGVAIGRDAFVNAGGTDAVAIGRQATASSEGSIALGYRSNANVKGSLAFANGVFGATGDAQGRTYILRAATTDATATVLTTDGNSTPSVFNGIRLDSDTVITFDGVITAMQNGAQAYAGWRVEGLIVNDGGTVSLANSAITVIQNLSNWGIALTADDPNNILRITATGEASHNIRWVANIRTVEVTYA